MNLDDKARLEEWSDEELDAAVEAARSMLVEAELKVRYYRWQCFIAMEELEYRKSGKPRRPAEYWEDFWNKECEDVTETSGASPEYVGEIALKIAKETRQSALLRGLLRGRSVQR